MIAALRDTEVEAVLAGFLAVLNLAQTIALAVIADRSRRVRRQDRRRQVD